MGCNKLMQTIVESEKTLNWKQGSKYVEFVF